MILILFVKSSTSTVYYLQTKQTIFLFIFTKWLLLLWRRRKKNSQVKTALLFVFWWRFDRRIIYYVENKMHHLKQKQTFIWCHSTCCYLLWFRMISNRCSTKLYYYRKTTTKKIQKRWCTGSFEKLLDNISKKKFLLHILQLLLY